MMMMMMMMMIGCYRRAIGDRCSDGKRSEHRYALVHMKLKGRQGYRLDGSGFESLEGKEIFLQKSRPAVGPTQPPVQWVSGFGRRPG